MMNSDKVLMNYSTFWSSLRVFGWILWFDVRFIVKDFWNNLLDSLVWPTALILMDGYILTALGMPADYGSFMTISMLVIMGAYTAWSSCASIAADLAGEQTISYQLTLPLPYWMVWAAKGLYLAIKSAVFSIFALVLGRLLLGDQFDLTNFSVLKFCIIYPLSCLFFGIFALWSTVVTANVEMRSRLDVRLIGPMLYINGSAASWATMYSVSSFFGIFALCTPWIYAYEGARVAAFGQTGYLPFWICVGMLSLFVAFFFITAIWLFKKRMDCV